MNAFGRKPWSDNYLLGSDLPEHGFLQPWRHIATFS